MSTALEIVGAALIVAAFGIGFGVSAALAIGGAFCVVFGLAADR